MSNQLQHIGPYKVQPMKQVAWQRRITHKDVGKVLGVSECSVNGIMNGRLNVTVARALKLSRFFDLPLEQLFTPELLGTDE